MYIDGSKKVLFLMDMELKWEDLQKQISTIKPENSIIIQNDVPSNIQPFGDIMRGIIVAVYRENIEEIYVVTSNEEDK